MFKPESNGREQSPRFRRNRCLQIWTGDGVLLSRGVYGEQVQFQSVPGSAAIGSIFVVVKKGRLVWSFAAFCRWHRPRGVVRVSAFVTSFQIGELAWESRPGPGFCIDAGNSFHSPRPDPKNESVPETQVRTMEGAAPAAQAGRRASQRATRAAKAQEEADKGDEKRKAADEKRKADAAQAQQDKQDAIQGTVWEYLDDVMEGMAESYKNVVAAGSFVSDTVRAGAYPVKEVIVKGFRSTRQVLRGSGGRSISGHGNADAQVPVCAGQTFSVSAVEVVPDDERRAQRYRAEGRAQSTDVY